MAKREKVAVVDKNDRILGWKYRDEITATDRFRITVVWIENSKGEALIHKRAATKELFPGRWENAAGGYVEFGETYRNNAYRELSEEIGVENVRLASIGKTLIQSQGAERFCRWYKAVLDWPVESFKLDAREVAAIKWIAKGKLFSHRDKYPDKYMPSSMFWRKFFS